MPLPASYDTIIYPNNIDFFRVVSNGNTPDSLVDARLVNKVSNALMAIESHCQFTTDTPTTTGYYLLLDRRSFQLTADLADPGLRLAVTFSLNPGITSNFFGNNPFNRNNAVFVSGTGYNIVGGFRNYFITRSAVNCGQENGNSTLTIDVIKTTGKWKAGDFYDVSVMVVRL